MPLAFVAHVARSEAALSMSQARALLDGEPLDWAELGEPPGPVRIVAASDTTSGPENIEPSDAEVIEAVEEDRSVIGIVTAAAVGPTVRALTVGGIDPLRDPAAYPFKTSGPMPERVTTMMLVGDIMLARRVGERISATDDDAFPFRLVAERLAAADLTIGNFESTLARLGPPTQGDAFAAEPRARAGLTLAGFDLLSLANNHAGDFGSASLLETIRLLDQANLPTVGAGQDRRAARRPVILERSGVRFGFLAFNAIGETPAATASRPGAVQIRMRPRTGPLDQDDLGAFVAAVEALTPKVDVLVVLPHWGAQYTHTRHRDQRRVARALAAAGADLIIGTHPHWVQGVEMIGDTFTAYSTGNFVFDMDFMRQTQEAVAVEAVLWGDRVKATALLPVRIGPDFRPRFIGGDAARAILEIVWRNSARPFSAT